MARYPSNSEYGAKNLVDLVVRLKQDIDAISGGTAPGSGIVRVKGDKASVSQLPSSAEEGDMWYVALRDAFYLWHDNGWRNIPAGRQSDTIEALPADPAELAALVAVMSEGAHLTLIKGDAGITGQTE